MKPKTSLIRSPRCGVCYWSLYDGNWCPNRKCAMSGKSVNKNRVQLTNQEAQILMAHMNK